MATLDAAVSIGEQVRRFWRWWRGQLRECVPAGIDRWLSRLNVVPLAVPEGGGYSLYRFDGARWQRVASVSGNSPETLAKALGDALRRAGAARFAVSLPPGQFLAKNISLPQAAEENLRNALRYELDRHTPFKADDVGFDCCVVGRDDRNREINVNLVIAPKATISLAVAGVAGTGLLVTAVRPGFPDRATLPIDLLPHDDNAEGNLLRLGRWVPWVLLVLLGLTALVLPIYQKRAQVIELQPQVNMAAQQAQAADILHQQLARAQAEYNFVLQKRYAAPTALQLLGEVTRILPDDTWLQSFALCRRQDDRAVRTIPAADRGELQIARDPGAGIAGLAVSSGNRRQGDSVASPARVDAASRHCRDGTGRHRHRTRRGRGTGCGDCTRRGHRTRRPRCDARRRHGDGAGRSESAPGF
ncbi:MAG: hypothetical protein IPI73_10405 [Betaproteobacteria bacterium]|nr:hypothetical protein [Betaproteobacteria bacterium]